MGPLQQILSELADAPPRRLTHTLYSLVVAAILEGRLAHGLRLPASRELAREIGISRNTIVSVYDRLMNEGYAMPRRGRGVFVTHAAQKSRPRSEGAGERHYRRHVAAHWQGVEKLDVSKEGVVHDLFPGVPDTSCFPADVWRRLCARAARQHRFGDRAYGETQGREGLRGAIASHLS